MSSTRKRRIDHGERGQVVPIVALALTVLFGAASLAIDVGYWRYQERVQQAAADSAAMAGASEIASGAVGVAAAAAYDATLNGFTDDGGVTEKVQVHYPPTSGAYNGNTSAVEVIVEKKQPGFFAKVLGINTQWVRARAVGAVNSWGRYCIYGLATSGTSVLFNGSTVNTPKCGIVSDADMTINGATVTAWSLGYVGSVINNGSTYPNNSAHPKKALLTSDPCPTIAGCAYLKANPPTSGTCITPLLYNGGTATMNPGKYCDTVVFNGCSSVVFNPGVYDFEKGTLMNGVTNVSGSGVTLYNNGGTLVINGTAAVNLTAPATGNTAGVLVYQNPADTNTFTANGSGGGFAGMIYAPTSQLILNGTLSQWLLIVGSTVTINGSGTNVASSAFPGWGRSVLAE